MHYLILVKHALPKVDPGVAAPKWRLAPEGRQRCIPLAAALASYHPGMIFTSREPKAVETGQLVASLLGLSCISVEALHEHQRLTVPFTNQQEFEARIARFFTEPDRLALGEETANQASTRFERAIRGLIARRPQETLVVVSHGTVISLFYQTLTSKDPYSLWRQLGLPSYLVFSLPGFELVEIVCEPYLDHQS